MNNRKVYYMKFDTIFGPAAIVGTDNTITALHFYIQNQKEVFENIMERKTPLLREGKKELLEYFNRRRTHFTIPLSQEGTVFQQKVWEALKMIPYGQTASYSEIAKIIGHPRAVRAVGNANNKNNIPIFVPCHRIIGKNGSLTGYAYGLAMKRKLLELEGVYNQNTI